MIEPLWSIIVIPLFWINTLFWDDARSLAAPENNGDRKIRSSIYHRIARKSRQRERKRLAWLPLLYFVASSWMIFSGTIRVPPMAYHGKQPIHPFTEVRGEE
jgi:hypothetical protein